MKPSKAYILYIDTPVSLEYAKTCADSCERIGLPYELFKGYTNLSICDAWEQTGVEPRDYRKWQSYEEPNNVQCCTAGHAAIWKLIADRNECAVILEHDAIMLQPIDIDIPENMIVVLGYKLKDPERYDHVTAGRPKRVFEINGHEGAHAYAMTSETAKTLVQELRTHGIRGAIDNMYFLMHQRTTRVPLGIMDPTPAVGWLRKSTLWSDSSTRNYAFIDSFRENYK